MSCSHPFLRQREWSVFAWVYRGGQMVPNGHALVSENVKSAERLIEMGLITKVSNKEAGLVSLGGPPLGIVCKLTPENVERYNLAMCCVALAAFARDTVTKETADV